MKSHLSLIHHFLELVSEFDPEMLTDKTKTFHKAQTIQSLQHIISQLTPELIADETILTALQLDASLIDDTLPTKLSTLKDIAPDTAWLNNLISASKHELTIKQKKGRSSYLLSLITDAKENAKSIEEPLASQYQASLTALEKKCEFLSTYPSDNTFEIIRNDLQELSNLLSANNHAALIDLDTIHKLFDEKDFIQKEHLLAAAFPEGLPLRFKKKIDILFGDCGNNYAKFLPQFLSRHVTFNKAQVLLKGHILPTEDAEKNIVFNIYRENPPERSKAVIEATDKEIQPMLNLKYEAESTLLQLRNDDKIVAPEEQCADLENEIQILERKIELTTQRIQEKSPAYKEWTRKTEQLNEAAKTEQLANEKKKTAFKKTFYEYQISNAYAIYNDRMQLQFTEKLKIKEKEFYAAAYQKKLDEANQQQGPVAMGEAEETCPPSKKYSKYLINSEREDLSKELEQGAKENALNFYKDEIDKAAKETMLSFIQNIKALIEDITANQGWKVGPFGGVPMTIKGVATKLPKRVHAIYSLCNNATKDSSVADIQKYFNDIMRTGHDAYNDKLSFFQKKGTTAFYKHFDDAEKNKAACKEAATKPKSK